MQTYTTNSRLLEKLIENFIEFILQLPRVIQPTTDMTKKTIEEINDIVFIKYWTNLFKPLQKQMNQQSLQ